MKKGRWQAIWLAVSIIASLGAGVHHANATNCGTAADLASGGLLPIYKGLTGNDPCNPSSATGHSPSPPTMTCSAPTLTGLPRWLKSPRGMAMYFFGGTCSSSDKPTGALTYRVEGKWTPTADSTKEPNASEIIVITGYESVFPDRAPGGQIFVTHTATCMQDPWITSNRNCALYGASLPEDIRASWSGIDTLIQNFPWTANVIPPADRKRLLAEYNAFNGIIGSASTSNVMRPVGAKKPSPVIVPKGVK